MVAQAAGLWVLLLVLAIANGVLRDRLLTPLLGPARALPLSGLVLSAMIVLVACWVLRPAHAGEAAAIGAGWAAATMAFDALFGHYVAKRPWRDLWAAYDPRGGNLWVVVVVVTAAAPLLAWTMRRL